MSEIKVTLALSEEELALAERFRAEFGVSLPSYLSAVASNALSRRLRELEEQANREESSLCSAAPAAAD